jgi:hypothetical protein
MPAQRTWVLTDVETDAGTEFLGITPNSAPDLPDGDWSVRRQILRGGLRDGVEVIEVCNGPLVFQVLPTRGMGLWRGDYRGTFLGWRAPVSGPVHPKFVNLADRGGIGWLAGFDEWLVRCGLASNGPPGDDGGKPLTLHGRIANCPAQRVEVNIKTDPPYAISITGVVEEGGLFLGRLRLTTTYTTNLDSNRIVVHDVVENRSAQPAELQMLYHLNMGEPFLQAGSRVLLPFRELAPHTPHAAKALATWETYAGPTAGFPEEVFDFRPAAGAENHCVALLRNAAGNLGIAVRWNAIELPCFTIWKNTGAREDGFVTGLEPATNYPYFKAHERSRGRVPVLPPGGRWEATWSIEVFDTKAPVDAIADEIAQLRDDGGAITHPSSVFGPQSASVSSGNE